ncbi:MAG: hypothetical protein H6Q13_3529, partial [Bacteroidetes bacterium]|nr:hypothetical protein [Bacteroidota bacterium]
MSWTTSGDKTRGYNFTYDNLSRLTAAGYLEGGTANTSYGTSYAYDKHGNMTNLSRNGRTGTSTFGTIDNLSMSYAGNQLIKADDAGTNFTLSASMDFKNNSTAAKEYFYDLNGNLTKDLNKGITGVIYNLLNLPQSVAISNTLGQATNTYMYAADSRKLQAVIGSKQTDYVGNVIYENASLKRILVDGGYIEGGAYYFYLTDHLGNNRVVANASGGIVQTNHYYPFGMSFAEGVTSSGQPYKYNGKELDTERGLNLYDYSARLMDPALGRFSTMDPLAEVDCSISPYAYCHNNAVNRTDPTGMFDLPEVEVVAPKIKKKSTLGYDLLQDILSSNNDKMQYMSGAISPMQLISFPGNNSLSVFTNNKDSKKGSNTLENVSIAISAAGISADNVEIIVRHTAGKEIVYVTLKGTAAAVSTQRVLSALKGIGNATIILGIVVDVGKSFSGGQSWLKTGVNTGVTAIAVLVGGVPGVAIGTGYVILDQLGAFDRPTISSSNYQRPLCPQDAIRVN